MSYTTKSKINSSSSTHNQKSSWIKSSWIKKEPYENQIQNWIEYLPNSLLSCTNCIHCNINYSIQHSTRYISSIIWCMLYISSLDNDPIIKINWIPCHKRIIRSGIVIINKEIV